MQRSSRFSRKANFIAFLLIGLIGVATFAIGKRIWSQVQQPVASGAAQAAAEPLPKEFPVDSFVPVGLPITLSNVIASVLKSEDNKHDGPVQINLQVAPNGSDRAQSLNFVLLGFKSSSELELVKGWVRNVDFSLTTRANVTLDLNRRITNGNKLVLVVERARSAANTYQTDFSELSQAVIASVRKQGDSPVPVQRSTTSLPDESGAELCNNALRRAVSLMQSSDKKGDKFGITSLRCDQQDRSYTFTYGKPKDNK
jgi:hypothetical protein